MRPVFRPERAPPTCGTGTPKGPQRVHGLRPLRSWGTGQEVVRAVSSMTKLVWREESSVPVNLTVTVWPAKEDRS